MRERNRGHRGRLIAAIGALFILVGCVPAWYTIGGSALPARSGNAFDGAGVIVFLAAVALLALFTLPYASLDRRPSVDRPASFALLAVVGVVGFALRLLQLGQLGVLGLPDRSPGLWLSGIGLLIVTWGVVEVFAESSSR